MVPDNAQTRVALVLWGTNSTDNLGTAEIASLDQWFSKCSSWTISITWELVRNAHSQAPPQDLMNQ